MAFTKLRSKHASKVIAVKLNIIIQFTLTLMKMTVYKTIHKWSDK